MVQNTVLCRLSEKKLTHKGNTFTIKDMPAGADSSLFSLMFFTSDVTGEASFVSISSQSPTLEQVVETLTEHGYTVVQES